MADEPKQEQQPEVDEDYEELVKRLQINDKSMPKYSYNLPEGEGPERPYQEGEPEQEREVSQTDHMNAKLLGAFAEMLDAGQFQFPQEVKEAEEEWSEE